MSKDRPILFSGPMVRAILEGRKTQTRRVVKCPQLEFAGAGGRTSEEWNDPAMWGYECENGEWVMLQPTGKEDHQLPCPYGVPGDRLWVRETFCQAFEDGYPVYNAEGNLDSSCCWYRADGTDVRCDDGDGGTKFNSDGSEASPWKPSIHMPRWASRITLKVKAVRVERLQQISEADAIAEGIQRNSFKPDEWIDYPEGTSLAGWMDPRHSYRSLWDSINTRPKLPENKGSKRYERVKKWLDKHPDCSWAVNPWVWVVEFERVV